MNYKIGQFKRTDLEVTAYSTKLGSLEEKTLQAKEVKSVYNSSYVDGAIAFSNNQILFTAGTTYKVEVTLALDRASSFKGALQFKLWDGQGKYQIVKHKSSINMSSPSSRKFTFFFMPRYDFSYMIFQMVRAGADANNAGIIQATAATITKMTNILKEQKMPEMVRKIGIQGNQNLVFSINGSNMQLGKSGIFMSKDIDITSICFDVESTTGHFTTDASGDKIYEQDGASFFIMDYQY